jgi:hypothetical protein
VGWLGTPDHTLFRKVVMKQIFFPKNNSIFANFFQLPFDFRQFFQLPFNFCQNFSASFQFSPNFSASFRGADDQLLEFDPAWNSGDKTRTDFFQQGDQMSL